MVIDWSTESQRFDCLLTRATHCHGIEIVALVAIAIRKLARRVAVLRKAIG